MLAMLELARRWRRIVVLTLLVGLVGAVVLATAAGARRSDSALDRFNRTSRTADLELTVGDATPAQLRALAKVPEVKAVAPLLGIALLFPKAPQLAAVAEALDGRFGTVVDRARVISGRQANPKSPSEVTIGETLASLLHLHVGDELVGTGYTPAQIEECITNGCGNPQPAGPRVRFHVVGIVRRPLDLGDRGASGGVLVTTPAFAKGPGAGIGSFGGDVLRVRTRNGAADIPKVAAAARRIFGSPKQFSSQDLAIDTQGATSAINVLTVALWVLAGVAGLAGLVVIGIVLSREISLTSSEQTTQSALGLTRGQRTAISGLLAVPIAIGGAVVAGVVAAVASPLFPIGVARLAEPDPGVRIDGFALGVGTVGIVVTVALIAVVAAVRSSRKVDDERATVGQAARLVEAAARSGVTPVATTGVQMALQPGRGRATLPVRSAIIGAALGILGVVSVSMFATSLDRLVATPSRYGWTWTFAAIPDQRSTVGAKSPAMRVPGVAAVAEVVSSAVEIDGHPVQAYSFRSVRGSIEPEIVAGRAARGPHEVALGAATLHELGKGLGDTIRMQGPDGTGSYRIVGRAVFAKFVDFPQALSNGAALTKAGMAAVVGPDDTSSGSPYLAFRAEPGANLAAVKRHINAVPKLQPAFGPSVPVEANRIQDVRWLTATIAALLAILGLLAVGHALVTSVRRFRHQLAILKTIGFDRAQVRGTVAWQASTLAVVGLVVGIPAGLIVGSVAWRLVANGLGVSATATVPVLAVLATAGGALLAVNVLAYLPARSAAATRPAVALHAE